MSPPGVFLQISSPRKPGLTKLTNMRFDLVVDFSDMPLKVAQTGSCDGELAVGAL